MLGLGGKGEGVRTSVKGCAQRQQAGGAVGQAAVQSLDDSSRLGLGGADAVGRVPARDRQGQGLAQLDGLVSDVAEVGAVHRQRQGILLGRNGELIAVFRDGQEDVAIEAVRRGAGCRVSTVTCSRLSRPSFKFSQVVVK